jgi:hypothetical protein
MEVCNRFLFMGLARNPGAPEEIVNDVELWNVDSSAGKIPDFRDQVGFDSSPYY